MSCFRIKRQREHLGCDFELVKIVDRVLEFSVARRRSARPIASVLRRIIALHAGGDESRAEDLAKAIEQEFVDAAKAKGLPGQVATPYERIAVDLATACGVQASANSDSDILVARTLAAAERASDRISKVG
jgi:hypothetical protein